MDALEKFDQEQQTVVANNGNDATTTQSASSKSPDSPAIATPPHQIDPLSNINRPEMVRAARQFLASPKVAQTPWEERRRFLLEKGLTDAEITEAAEGLVAQQGYSGVSSTVPPSVPPVPAGGFLGWANTAVVAGGASYVAYKLVREWILPKFFDIPADPAQERINLMQTQMNELQNSTKFIMDSVVQTLETVSAQQEQLNRALVLMQNGAYNSSNAHGSSINNRDVERLHSDLAIVKSLMLNQSRFPPPVPKNAQANLATASGMTNGSKSAPHHHQRHSNSGNRPHQRGASHLPTSHSATNGTHGVINEEEEGEDDGDAGGITDQGSVIGQRVGEQSRVNNNASDDKTDEV